MFNTILLAVDVNHKGALEKAVAAAVGIASGFKSKLHVLAVVPDFEMPVLSQYFPADFEKKALQATKDELSAILEKQVPSSLSVETHVALGHVYEQIVKQAKGLGADLIIVGARNSDIKDYLVGSNASRIVSHAPQSVLIVRE